jgi:hypothetical protein
MNRNKKKITAYVSAALLFGLLLSLGRAVSIPARSAPGSPFFTVSVNTLSADSLTPMSANILRRSLSGNRPDTGEDPESSWTARSYKECSITLPADAEGEASESVKSSGRIAGKQGISFSSGDLTRMAEVIDASNGLMK